MKRELILKVLSKTARTTAVLLDIFIGNATYRNLKRKVFYPTLPDFSTAKIENESFLKKRTSSFYAMLSQLKKQGFIKKERKDNKNCWIITSLGRRKLKKFKNIIRFPKIMYKKEKSGGLNIIVFDIPEKEKWKRNWLRQVLLSLEFTMLQKSVWIGENKLPESFIKDLRVLNLSDFIHIFSVYKSGTLSKFTAKR